LQRTCLLLTQSGHGSRIAKCPLMTQSGRARVYLAVIQQQNIKGCREQSALAAIRNADANREPHKRDTPTAARAYRRLLTLLAILLVLAMFVFAPLQAVGIFVFQGFAIAALLAIIGGMLVISDNPTALAVVSVGLAANVVVFFLRLFYAPWPYNLYVLAAAWLAIAVTLGVVVAQAVFRRGRVTYHRIIGAILLYLLIAVAFGTLFIFIGLSLPNAFKGITFEDNPALANSVFYLSFVTLTLTGYGDIVPVHPMARSLCNVESVIGQLYPATLLVRLVTLELRQRT
jgi:Ion channel